ncbi:hypothetical protein GOZ80_26090 [Agrobacterium vitis]|uniref:Uncharacterized protein n=1 Tax=Agrobacterium vitis TaxID=373 RepID=A0AAE4WZU4_AGRVI|nr:hypothetical protein [Agrobacterium vitis]MBF2714240.1 hypothetical protein [Agrobacterium vitis]MUO82267.1 hypothetical protein [Agrobacterium vitis]MUO97668.1 hypothetical protein [Agrobacterium vitis]MUP05591.1 hypothetical protein [Agrobacterium vitis]MVA95436.1 hypothetical protein [Agrobacterium vitis]
MADSDNSRTLPSVTRQHFQSLHGTTFPTERVAKVAIIASSNDECRLIPTVFKQSVAVRQIWHRPGGQQTSQDPAAVG